MAFKDLHKNLLLQNAMPRTKAPIKCMQILHHQGKNPIKMAQLPRAKITSWEGKKRGRGAGSVDTTDRFPHYIRHN